MAKKKGSNKMTYRPLKNSNMIGAGKKETKEQILKRGSQAKPPEKTHVQQVKENASKEVKKTKSQQIKDERAKLAQKSKMIQKAKTKTTPTKKR
jgi:hypothetical protein